MAPVELAVGVRAETSPWRWVATWKIEGEASVKALQPGLGETYLAGQEVRQIPLHKFPLHEISTASALSGCSTEGLSGCDHGGSAGWKVCMGRTLWALEGFAISLHQQL